MADILMRRRDLKMRIEILTEDKSGSVVVERMARAICEGVGVDASEVPSGSGVGLVSGHSGGPVVQDHHDDVVVVEEG